MQGWCLGWEDPLEEEMATHSSILAWKTPWTEEPGGLVCGVTKSRTWLSRHDHAQEMLNSESWDSACRKCPCALQYSSSLGLPGRGACGPELPRSFLLPGSPPRLQANSAGSLPLGSNEWLVHFLYPAGCYKGLPGCLKPRFLPLEAPDLGKKGLQKRKEFKGTKKDVTRQKSYS